MEKHPDLDSLSLQRCSAAGILAEIEKVRSQERYDAKALVDWYVKLGRVAKGYANVISKYRSRIRRTTQGTASNDRTGKDPSKLR
jgi:hypothetical protein